MQPDLEIDLLRAFIAVAESGGFTTAAPLVGRSQSAVSQKILRLETILGSRIFDRTSRSLSLTVEGEKLLVAARKMIEFNDKLVRELREPYTEGRLRLGISEDAIPRQLPSILARFSRTYPRIQVEVTTGLSCDLVSAYDDGLLDAIIAKRSSRTYEGTVIWREQLNWLSSVENPPDLEGPVRLVMLPKPCSYRELIIEKLNRIKRDWTISCTASSLLGAQAAVEGGLGVSVLGRSFIRSGIRALPFDEQWPPLPMMEVMIFAEEARTTDVVRPLVSYLTENLAQKGNQAAELSISFPND